MRGLISVHKQNRGFTLVEIMVVFVIIAVLFALASINLGHATSSTSLNTVANTLLADLKSQQLMAMAGDKGSNTLQQPHGIYIQSNDYVLFADNTYSGSDPSNYTVNTNSVSLSTSFPSSEVVFNKGDGSVNGFSSGNNTITLTETGSSKTVTVNRLGATTLN